jgi:lysophospholipase L1-like esterase
MEKLKGISRRCMFVAAVSVLVVIGAASLSPARAQGTAQETEFGGPRWVATWSVPPMAHGSAFGGSRSFENQTVRQIVYISAGGTRVRVKLSNEYGVGALIIGSAHIAVQSTGASIVPESDRTLKFGGQTSVVIPEGTVALSDPVNLSVPSNTSLAISLYVPQNTGFATYHENATQTAYISGPGDFSAAIGFPVQETAISRYWLTFVEVLPQKKVGVLAIFGDSVSEGSTTTLDANRRVTDVLSRRFNPLRDPPRLAVLNQSTGCGRLLRDFCGPSGLSRFERDVLNAAGITQVVLELGYGDIIFPTAVGDPTQIVSADEIIAGIRQLIRQARMRGLKVYGTTITPNEGTTFPNVHTPENEAKRQAVNHWVRTSRQFDAVADYDLALRDPSDPARLLPAYAAPDNIHPNDAGHEALARAIALSLR